MKKKSDYTEPNIKVFTLRPTRPLMTSDEDKRTLRWSGNKTGTAGPDELDEESTFDSF